MLRTASRAARAAAGILGAAALAGCVASKPMDANETQPPKTSLASIGPANAAPSTAQIYGGAKAPPQESAAPVSPALKGVDDPKKLVGLDRAQIEALLGQPAMQRREAAAELWQYRAANCVLDVFLYAGSNGQMRVTHADLRGRRENRPAPRGCLAEIAGALGRPQTARN